MKQSIRVMVAPLDWGLGHATRCVPVIEGLLARKAEVILGSSGDSLAVLKAYYPQLPFIELPSYRIRYGKGHGQFRNLARIGRQIPQVFRAIRAEHEVLKNLVEKEGLDVCISDHRLGMWHPDIPSMVIAHQIAIQPPTYLKGLAPVLLRWHWKYLDRFDQVWVPDFPRPHDLAGDLVPPQLAQNPKLRYLGPLSRFTSLPSLSHDPHPGSPELAMVLSGPEPQRSLLEKKLREQAKMLGRKTVLVQGLPGEKKVTDEGNLRTISFMGTAELSTLLRQADVVISRSGYSSLLDYAALGLKKVVLIPTPGQTEQEYLGRRLHEKGVAYSVTQKRFSLAKALEALPKFEGFPPGQGTESYLKKALDALFVRNVIINS